MKRALILLAAIAALALSSLAQNNANMQLNLTASGTGCTATNCVALTLPSGVATVAVTLSGTFTATVQFEISADGANYVSANALPQPSGASVSSATGTGTWAIPAAGMLVARARISNYTSGTVSAFLMSSSAPVATQQSGGSTLSQVQGTAAAGSAPSGNPVLVAGQDATPNVRVLKTDSNGFLAVVGAAGSDALGNANIGYLGSSIGAGGVNGLSIAPLFFNGSTWDRQFYCPNSATFSVAATTTQVVAISGSTKIRVCSFIMSGNATAGSMALVTGTGTNCATGQTSVSGTINVLGTTAAPVVYTGGATAPLITPAGQALCVLATTTTASGVVTYAQF